MDPGLVKLNLFNSVHDIFSHCTLALILTTKPVNPIIPVHPLLIYYAILEFPKDMKTRHKRVSFIRRKHPTQYCWTYVFTNILDSKNGKKIPRIKDLLSIPIFHMKSACYMQLLWISFNIQVNQGSHLIYQ